jgi:hypothetical protein
MTKTDILPLRAFGQYLLGLLMVVQRAAGGNTTYFIGEVSASGWGQYFPTVYALKEPLALHILTLAAVIFSIWGLLFRRKTVVFADNSFSSRLAGWLHNNFVSLAMLFFIAFYWFMSVRSPLNIGVRHVLPTFPFIFALVASQITAWTRTGKKGFTVLKNILVGFLLLSQAIAIVAIYPYFLSYFNEIAGGPENGHKYVVDSNLDWGQDLKRLAKWSDENGVNKIYLEYFGGATAPYYLGKKFQPWWGMRDPKDLKSGEWIAVSATLLMGGQGKPARGYASPTGYYDWLKAYEPKTIIGHSIFVFQKP